MNKEIIEQLMLVTNVLVEIIKIIQKNRRLGIWWCINPYKVLDEILEQIANLDAKDIQWRDY